MYQLTSQELFDINGGTTKVSGVLIGSLRIVIANVITSVVKLFK